MHSLLAYPEHYYFDDTTAGSYARESSVKQTVLLILGTWLLSQSYFVPLHQNQRRIVYAYCWTTNQPYSEVDAFDQSVSHLISESGLLPNADECRRLADDSVSSLEVIEPSEGTAAFHLHASVGLLESLSIDSRKLNATKLSTYGHVKIAWTQNILRHMLLSKRADTHYLELFALVPLTEAQRQSFQSTDLIDEIEHSYATLFNPVPEAKWHKTLAWVTGIHLWCWCLHCTAYRSKQQILGTLKDAKRRQPETLSLETSYRVTYDDRLRVLMERKASQWDQTDFRNLWPRILALDSHLQRARPWSFWVLFRDRRDTVQYWTFL